jgi:hypothetical protein
MTIFPVIIGYLISTLGGALVLWLLIDKMAWGYLAKKGILGKEPGILTLPMGILERFMYTTVFIVNQPAFVAVWLALKVASQWKRWEDNKQRGTYNVFLIGSAISLIIAFLGAWVTLGHVPLLESK